MEQTGQLDALREADGPDHAGRGHPDLERFDRVRELLARTGLPPEPETYELFYLHVTHTDAALSREMDRLLAAGELNSEAVKGLRRSYLGDVAGAEVYAERKAA